MTTQKTPDDFQIKHPKHVDPLEHPFEATPPLKDTDSKRTREKQTKQRDTEQA